MSRASASIRKPLIGFTVFAVVAILLSYIIYSTLERSVSGETRNFTTSFNDASGLAKGDDVRMAGVRVGRVEKIELAKSKAKVTFEVRKDQPVYTNSKAAIRYQNLVGQRYLNLSLVDNLPQDPLREGLALKPPSEDSFDVTKLLAGFQPVFETLKPETVNSLSNGLVKAFQGDSVSLSNTIAQIGQVASDMANRDIVIGAVIDNLSGVMRDLSRQGGQLHTLLASLSTVIGDLNTRSGQLGRAVTQIGDTTSGFADVLTRSRGDLSSAAIAARGATNTLIATGSKLDNTARVLPDFLAHVSNVLGQGDYLNVYACDLDISIGNVLFPPGIINKIGGTNHSVVCR